MAGSWTPGMDNGPIDRGWYVKTPDTSPDSGGEGRRGANGYLELAGQRVWLWINEVTADFALAGETAQSKGQRQFFPHNFVQPSLVISGQTPNSYQYNRIAEFIRLHHKATLQSDDPMKLVITGGGKDTKRPTIKGHRSYIRVMGYVDNVARGAERFVNAPDYQFNFVITNVDKLLGLEQDRLVSVQYKDIIKIISLPGYGYTLEEGGKPDYGDDGGRLNEPSQSAPDPPQVDPTGVNPNPGPGI